MCIAPFIFLVIFRYTLIRKARNVEVVKMRRQTESRKDRRKARLTNSALENTNSSMPMSMGLEDKPAEEMETYFKIDTHYCKDFGHALWIWNHAVIVDVYFN